MSKHHPVILPKLGARNLKATVLAWCKNLGEWVALGDKLCIVETTKAAYEIWADREGFLVHLVPVGATLWAGDPVAELSLEEE